MTKQELIVLFEHIRYQLVAFDTEATNALPSSVGSAFGLEYKGKKFLMTADHVVNTHNNGTRRLDKTAAIQTNIIEENSNGQPCCLLVGLVGIYFFDQFNVSLATGNISVKELFDGAFVLMNKSFLDKTYVTQLIDFAGVKIKYGEPKCFLNESSIVSPSPLDEYCVFGRIRFGIIKDENVTYLKSELTYKEKLKYVGENGNYYVLQSPIDFIYEDWAGLSGSAVLNQDGKLIGIACAVIMSERKILVKKIQLMIPLMDAAIMQEDTNQN